MEIIFILLVLLAVARGLGEVAVRLGQPPLVGELLAGVLIGTVASEFHEYMPLLVGLNDNETFLAIADLGVFFLMLLGGVELQARNISNASKSAIVVAIFGMIVPFAAGFSTGMYLFQSSAYKLSQCMFLGTALAITAVPVAIRVLMDMNKLNSPVGSIIVSAAVIDDVLSLALLAILTGIIADGVLPGANELLILSGKVCLFFIICTLIGKYVFPRFSFIVKLKSPELEFSGLVLAALALSVLAEYLHLHFILGAFMAGLFFGKSAAGYKTYKDVKLKLNATTMGFLAPIFFVSIGLNLDISALIEEPLFVLFILVIAVLTKVIGAGLPAKLLGFSAQDSTAIGIAMSSRGAVEIIIADIALRAGLFTQPEPVPPEIKYLFSTIVIGAIATTILTPIGLKLVYQTKKE